MHYVWKYIKGSQRFNFAKASAISCQDKTFLLLLIWTSTKAWQNEKYYFPNGFAFWRSDMFPYLSVSLSLLAYFLFYFTEYS